MNSPKGISIILCGFNSSLLLPETLQHLALVKIPESYQVELLVIDNASDDETGQVAKTLWQELNTPFPQHIHHENQPGLMFARKKGLAMSKYPYIVFVDDDNRLNENYLIELVAVFENHPKCAALGGINNAVFESEKPDWFHLFDHSFAVGRLAKAFGEPDEIGLFGAGLCIRKKAYDDLSKKGFTSVLVGRTGENLSSGEDYEMCKALKIAGWEILFSPKLILDHFITKSRLNWNYLKKLNRGISHSIIWFLAYEYWIRKVKKPGNTIIDIKFSWLFLLISKTLKLWLQGLIIVFRPGNKAEGSRLHIELERTKITIRDLLLYKKEFINLKKEIGLAKWNKLNQQP